MNPIACSDVQFSLLISVQQIRAVNTGGLFPHTPRNASFGPLIK
jgi:hypothetical protein